MYREATRARSSLLELSQFLPTRSLFIFILINHPGDTWLQNMLNKELCQRSAMYLLLASPSLGPYECTYAQISRTNSMGKYLVTTLFTLQKQAGLIYAVFFFNFQAYEARDDVRMDLFKPSLCWESQLMEIKKCIEIGLLCVELNKEDRPTMEDVLGMLNGV